MMQQMFQSSLVACICIMRTVCMQVIVAEAAPRLQGLTMAKQLTDAGISTLVIPDAAIFALMARVNKVLVGAQAVLATGGALAQAGSALVAQAAKHYRVPFVVITGMLLPLACSVSLSPERASCSVMLLGVAEAASA